MEEAELSEGAKLKDAQRVCPESAKHTEKKPALMTLKQKVKKWYGRKIGTLCRCVGVRL